MFFMLYLSISLLVIIIRIFFLLIFYRIKYMLSLFLLSWGGNFWRLKVNFDRVTIRILLMLFICFIYVLNYRYHYFNKGIEVKYLKSIIILFVLTMASLVCTGDYLLTLVFWEYLGVVRFFLILFYDRYLSLRSSIVTLVSSRFGDVSLFLLIALNCFINSPNLLLLLVFLLIIFTKRARFPFIRWLLEAMRAPTPVSALVHSSTLVAAGVWFAMRYDFYLYLKNIDNIFIVVLLLTIFVTGVCCFYFIDLKKIVALSTCNKIAWCVFYLFFGDVVLSLFQLVSHGVSKCMLFMLVGDVMRGRRGSQARNCVYSSSLYGNWNIFSLFCVILGLSGTPFIGVFFSKHFLLRKFMKTENILLYLFVLGCVFLSYFYSFRLCTILIKLKSSIMTGTLYFFNTRIMTYFWLFIKFFICFLLDESVRLKVTSRNMLIIFQLIACLTAYYMYSKIMFRNWSSSLYGCDKLVELLYELYAELSDKIKLFFYRWDNYIINLFKGLCENIINIYTINFLKMVVLTIFLFLTCYIIIY